MTNNIKRIEANFDDTNAVIEAAIQVELTIIDGLGGSIVGYTESYNYGMNNIICTMIYTLP